jgi:MoxR-like ATPase
VASAEDGGLASARDAGRRLVANVERVVLGKHDEVSLVVAAFAASGHVLLEDVPGTAKTVLARALAASIEGATAQRIQGTPDLQPTDATGLAIFDPRTREFEFRAGPLFANVVLVDEINRAMPRTQSALLEAMAERQVTVDGTTRALPDPFLLIATENPIDLEGTFPLPEAQLDRFAIRTALGYPDADQEVRILLEQRERHPLDSLTPAVTVEETRALRAAIGAVYVDDLLLRWMVDLVRATREVAGVLLGASVRGSLALQRVAAARALLAGRDYVTPGDVEALFLPVLGHRLRVDPTAFADARVASRAELLERVRAASLALAPPPPADVAELAATAADSAR